MTQFDVYKNKSRSTKMLYPYLLDIQSNLLSDLQTTVVIPLAKESDYDGGKLKILHPILDVLGTQYVSITTLFAGIERSNLGVKMASLSDSRDKIISAFDFMITDI